MRKIRRTVTTIGIWLVAQIIITVLFSMIAMIQHREVNSIIAPALLVSDLIAIIAYMILRYCRLKDLVKPVPAVVLLISLAFGMCAMMAVNLLSEQLVSVPDLMKAQFEAMSKSVWGFWGICIVGPIMEEIMMRRIILREMRKATKSMWWGIFISSAIFAVIHINPIQVVFALPAGIILGWLYCKTGSLLVPICLHILNNTFSFVSMRFDTGAEEISLNTIIGQILFVVLCLVSAASLIWILIYYSKQKKDSLAQTAVQVQPDEVPSHDAFDGDKYDK